MDYVGSGCLMWEWSAGASGGAGGHILHWSLNPISLSLCCREIGTFLDLKRYRSGIYWGIYSRGGVTALHWRRRGYMGGGGTLRRVHTEYTEILRQEYTKALHTMDIRPHIKLKTMLWIRNVCTQESLCLWLCPLSRGQPCSQQFANYRSAVMTGPFELGRSLLKHWPACKALSHPLTCYPLDLQINLCQTFKWYGYGQQRNQDWYLSHSSLL